MPQIEFKDRFSSLVVGDRTYSFFLKLERIQQWEFDISVSPLPKEIGNWEGKDDSNFFERSNLVKLDIWAFYGFFDIWVDKKVILSGRKRARMTD